MALPTVKYRITCIVDNSVAINSKLHGEHGSAVMIDAGPHKILFGCGTTPEILAYNAKVLDIDLSRIKYIVLSHGHQSQTGSLEWLLSQTRQPMIIGDSTVLDSKYQRVEKEFKIIGSPIKKDKAKEVAQIQFSETSYAVAPGILVSGRIQRTVPIEAPTDQYFIETHGMFDIDQFNDDRCIVLDLDKSVIVLVGCAHAGIVNTLSQVTKATQKSVAAVVGSIHLNDANPDKIIKTVTAIREKIKPAAMYLNHCTGTDAFMALRNAMGNIIKNFPAGTTLTF